jgi:hypothetical protein
MAVAIIAGILFATFLTLVLVPVLYSLVDDATRLFRRHYVYDGSEGTGAEDGAQEVVDAPPPSRPTQPVAPEPEPVGARRVRTRLGRGLDPRPEAG